MSIYAEIVNLMKEISPVGLIKFPPWQRRLKIYWVFVSFVVDGNLAQKFLRIFEEEISSVVI